MRQYLGVGLAPQPQCTKLMLMRTLIYKRTHTGDPDAAGRFGIHGCMGRVRRWSFDAVIGIGGLGEEPSRHGIDGRITWIGIGPHETLAEDARGPLVTFDHFLLLDTRGPLLYDHAPHLAKHMYDGRVRVLLEPTAKEAKEIARILCLARNAPASSTVGIAGAVETVACACGKRRSRRCPNHRSATDDCSPVAKRISRKPRSSRQRSNDR